MNTMSRWMILGLLTFAVFTADVLASKPNASVDCKNESQYAEISKEELQKAIQENAVFVVDVNSSSTYKEHHVTGAIHYKTTPNFAKALPADKSKMIVAYCGGPKCTAWKKAAIEACQNGHTNIRHYKDGISGWIKK